MKSVGSTTSRSSAPQKSSASLRGDASKSARSEDRRAIIADSRHDFSVGPEDETVRLTELRKIPSDASLTALSPTSPSTIVTPITPSLTTSASVTTDDEEGDYQSAYSTSPRASYGSLDHYGVHTDPDDRDLGTPTTLSKGYHIDFEQTYRERASSTSTTKDTNNRYRASEDIVVTSPIGSI
jgi:EEF1A N-terminal glycine/lysine methyltransferase